jgi:type IV secretion system protein VirB4
LFYTYTTGETPYRFNLHVSDVGNGLVVGPTGAGKSTLLGLIVSQFFRYPNAQVFVFDKGRSLLPLTYAAGGHHYELGGETDTLQFCPLQNLDSPSDILWATGYLEQLVQLRNLPLTPKLSTQIARAVQLMAQQQPPGESLTLAKHPVGRSLTDFCATVQSQALREALRHYTLEGPLGGLLDAENDNLAMDRFVTFELADLMRLGRSTVVPILLYLFRRITLRLQGQPTLILCDEAWVMLMDELFGGMFEEWLRTVRKLVGAVVLSTQNIGDLLKSPFANVIIESCPTRVLLPNPEAMNTASRPFYEALGLTENQIETIRLAVPKRDYFYTSPIGRRLFDLRLGPTALSFIGATGSDDIAAVQACMDREGEDWPAAWLRERGLSMQANQWEQLAYVSEQYAMGGASRAVSA